jgi:hypothetical protein
MTCRYDLLGSILTGLMSSRTFSVFWERGGAKKMTGYRQAGSGGRWCWYRSKEELLR